MPAKDIIHDAVITALQKDGWIITDDPLILVLREENIAIDLGAEKVITAEKGNEQIAIEIKSFTRPSVLYTFHEALGQYFNYETALLELQENRILYLAVSKEVYQNMSGNFLIRKSIERSGMKILVVNLQQQTIVEWIK